MENKKKEFSAEDLETKRQCELLFDGAEENQKVAMLSASFGNITSRLAAIGPHIFRSVKKISKRNDGQIYVLAIVWRAFGDLCGSDCPIPPMGVYKLADINVKDRALVDSVTTGPNSDFDKKTNYIVLQTFVRPGAEDMSFAAVFDTNFQKKHFAKPENAVNAYKFMYRRCDGCDELKAGCKKCDTCKVAYYCGRDCQAAVWKEHKKTCGQ
jgi:hypothetical protein